MNFKKKKMKEEIQESTREGRCEYDFKKKIQGPGIVASNDPQHPEVFRHVKEVGDENECK